MIFCIWAKLFICCSFIFSLNKADVTVEYLNVATQIEARFATTIIVSKIRNDEGTAKEVTFTAELPEAAFISNFSMFINDKIVVGEVKEKEAAKIAYDRAKARGESAGHVAQKPRETNMFQISVNVAAYDKAVFNLTYQEMLKRVHGVYKHIINLIPDQTVDKVQMNVYITESGEVSKIKIPKFAPKIGEKTNKEILSLEDEKDVDVKKNIKDKVSNIQVTFKPTGASKAGQLVVLYDVQRAAKSGGEIEVVNGYFVHFFAPEGFKSGNKHVIFVLDRSGSMLGRKMEQLKDAMKTILSDLEPADKFNIVMFSSDVEKWKSESIMATSDNVKDAQEYVRRQSATGSTALNDALVQSLQMLHADTSKTTLTSMILFMTDGQPTEGETNSDKIVSNVDKADTKNYPIHSLAFGEDADYNILKRVSGKHFGLARKIYEDSDATLQMTGFFDEIRSPVLTEMKIDYLDEKIELDSIVQGDHVHHYYDGSEVVVVGKLKDSASGDAQLKVTVSAMSSSGPVAMEARSAYWICPDYIYDEVVAPVFWRCCPPYALNVVRYPCCWPDCCWGYYDYCLPRPPPPVTPKPKAILPSNTAGGFLERMWAYQTIKKLLKQAELDEVGQRTSLRQKALELSLKYNFVTELTSMVVIDPLQTWRPLFEKVLPAANKGDSSTNSLGTGGSSLGAFAGAGESSKNAGESAFPPPPVGPKQPTDGDDEEGQAATNPPKPPPSGTTTKTRTTISADTKAPVTGCHVNAAFVLDTSGDSEKTTYLVRKTIDSLTTMFSKNIQLTLISVSRDRTGKVAQLHRANNVILESEALKDALKQTPATFNLDLFATLKDALGQRSTGKPVVAFFVGNQPLAQYAVDVVANLKKAFPSAQILAISAQSDTAAGPNVKDLESLTGSNLNVFVTPQGSDIAQSLNC